MAKETVLFSHFTALQICSALAQRDADAAHAARPFAPAESAAPADPVAPAALAAPAAPDKSADPLSLAAPLAATACAKQTTADSTFARKQPVRLVYDPRSALTKWDPPYCRAAFAPQSPANAKRLEQAAREAQLIASLREINRPMHILTSSEAQNRSLAPFARVHFRGGRLPRKSIVKLSDRTLTCAPEYALVQIAAKERSIIALLEIGYELCGTYRELLAKQPRPYDAPALATAESIAAFVGENPSIHGSRAIKRILPYLANGSASPRETKLALLLGLPRRLGGYGLGIPQMNLPVDFDSRAQSIALRASARCDLHWPESKLDVEYQSKFAHEGERARIRDSRRANALAAMGWTTISITNEELNSKTACDAIAEAIRKVLKRKRRLDPQDFDRRNRELRYELDLPM